MAGSDFCWSCGRDPESSVGDSCRRCGTPRALPSRYRESLLGVRVVLKRGDPSGTGVVKEEYGDSVVVASGTTSAVHRRSDVRAADDLERIRPTGPIYRLYESGERELAVSLLSSLSARRSFASDALANGDRPAIERSGLSHTERTWLTMWLEHNAGDRAAAAVIGLALPHDAYPDKLPVIARAAEWWGADDGLRAQAGAAAAALAGWSGAQLVSWLAGDDRPAALAGALEDVAALRDWFMLQPGDEDGSLLVHGSVDVEAVCQVLSSQGTSPEARTLRLLGGDPLNVEELGGLPAWALEEGLTRGLLTPSQLAFPGVLDELPTSERQQLEAKMHVVEHDPEERHRRAFLGLAPPIPDDTHPAARRFELLAALRDGDPRAVAELVPLLPEHDRPTAVAVGRSLATGTLEPTAARDATTWPTLTPLVLECSHWADAEPEVLDMAGWVLLEEATRAAFDWDFDTARTLADRCRSVVDDEARHDEALSILACCAWMCGDDLAAEGLLREAIEGEASDSLLVNYAVVSADSSPRNSVRALNRLMASSADDEVRHHAALNSAERTWRLAMGSELPTGEVVRELRRAAVADTSIDVHARVMHMLAWADRRWVADPANTQRSPHAGSPEHRRALFSVGPMSERISILAAHLTAAPDDPALLRDRDRLVEELVAELTSATAPRVELAHQGFELIGAGVPMGPRHAVLVPVLSVHMALWAESSSPRSGPLPSEWADHLDAGGRSLREVQENDGREELRRLVGHVYGVWAATEIPRWEAQLAGMRERFSGAVAQHDYLSGAVATAYDLVPVREQLHDHLGELLPEVDGLRNDVYRILAPLDSEDGHRRAAEEVAAGADELSHRIKVALA